MNDDVPAGRPGLFDAVGVELEYMIVDGRTLRVLPIADRVLVTEDGETESEIEHDALAWSNELVSHVVELKTNGPAPGLRGLAAEFQADVGEINERLRDAGACLMPGAMHPTMDPARETVLWPHEYGPVYDAFNRIFDCRGHGWANLQSAHLNLPFATDEEFGRLHAAVRLVLPVIPALAASSPVAAGVATTWLDYRMEVYRHNAARVPSVAGRVVPEPAVTEADYRTAILEPVYRDLAPLDPEGLLRHEWVNGRGAIARFDRGTVEIRVTDVQEYPAADLAVAAAVTAAVAALARDGTVTDQNAIPTHRLADLFERTIRTGERTVIDDREYLARFGLHDRVTMSAHDLWSHLVETHVRPDPGAVEFLPALDVILREGTLARRIIARLGGSNPDPKDIRRVYRELCDCLAEGRMLHGRR